jgi:hypothetical protein
VTGDQFLAGLPGSDSRPGSGPCTPVLFDGLLDAPDPAELVHLLESEHADLAGALLVAAEAAAALPDQLGRSAHGLRVLLTAEGPPGTAVPALQQARGALLADGRVEVVGVRLALPGSGDPAAAATRLLDQLEFAVPAWVELPGAAGWRQAWDTLAADGAEAVCVRVAAAGDTAASGLPTDELAAMLRRAVDSDLSLRLSGPIVPVTAQDGRIGLLNLVCGLRAALTGANAQQVTAVLSHPRPEPLASALRRMSAADAAVLRAFLAGAEVASVPDTVAGLRTLGLLPDPD